VALIQEEGLMPFCVEVLMEVKGQVSGTVSYGKLMSANNCFEILSRKYMA
jgi:hypothetical protein